METSGPGETPHEFDDNRNHHEPPSGGSGFEGMEPNETILTPAGDIPATEHEPEWPEEPEPAPEIPFGVDRFEPVEPQLEGKPPTEFLVETSSKVRDAVVRAERDYGLFHDQETVYDDEGNMVGHVDGLELVYEAPEGNVDIVISGTTSSVSGPSIQMRFTDVDGQVTDARYVGHEEVWPDEDVRMSVIHRDRYYPAAGAPWAVPADVPPRDVMRWRADDQEWATESLHSRLESGEIVDFPWIGPEEAAYVSKILANAEPAGATLDDLADVMGREYHEENREGPPHMGEADDAHFLFALLHDAYRGNLMTVDQVIAGDTDVKQEFNDDQLTTKIYAQQIATPGGPASILAIHRVGDVTGEAAARVLSRIGIEGPASDVPIAVVEDIWIGETESGLDGRYRLRIGGEREEIVTYQLQPAAPTIKALRAYLFAGEAYKARQAAADEPND